jgi:hypothetical protein
MYMKHHSETKWWSYNIRYLPGRQDPPLRQTSVVRIVSIWRFKNSTAKLAVEKPVLQSPRGEGVNCSLERQKAADLRINVQCRPD